MTNAHPGAHGMLSWRRNLENCRMQHAVKGTARRKAANLTINADLLNKARAQTINLSALLERALIEELKSRSARSWLEENRDAMAAYNEEAAKHGVFSDGIRSF